MDGIARSEIFCEATSEEVIEACERANQAFIEFSQLPNTSRGQFLRRIADLLQQQKENLEDIVAESKE